MSMKPRPTTYNGIAMRSRLEARVAAWLDSLGLRWTYEPQAFGAPEGQYLPDFEIDTSNARHLAQRMFLEVKGAVELEEYFELQRRIAAIVTASDPRAFIILADESMLQAGLVSVYNLPLIGQWGEMYFIEALLQSRAIAVPAGWRLPPWSAT